MFRNLVACSNPSDGTLASDNVIEFATAENEGPSPASGAAANSSEPKEVRQRVASEMLQCSEESLRLAETMISKGEALLLSAAGTTTDSDEGHTVAFGARTGEGLDEREVFMSLMRSLPKDGPLLNRQGYSAPHLMCCSPKAGLMRNRSTMQLHQIAEQLQHLDGTSSDKLNIPEGSRVNTGRAAGGASGGIEETLLGVASKVKLLEHQLERVRDAHRDIKEQLCPMREEHGRRLEECRFLEGQCKRLDVHCRLLEERALNMEAGDGMKIRLTDPGTPVKGAAGAGFAWPSGSSFQRALGGSSAMVAPTGFGSSHISSASSTGAAVQPILACPNSVQNCPPKLRVGLQGVGASGSGMMRSPRAQTYSSQTSLTHPLSNPCNNTEVSPGNVLCPASTQELPLDGSAPNAVPHGANLVRPNVGLGPSANRKDDLMRRVYSAPQLPASSLHVERQSSCRYAYRGISRPVALSARAAPSGNLVSTAGGPTVSSAGALTSGANSAGLSLESVGSGGGGEPAFKSSVFLSLAKRPGAKLAAMQYLMSSTSGALGLAEEVHRLNSSVPVPVVYGSNQASHPTLRKSGSSMSIHGNERGEQASSPQSAKQVSQSSKIISPAVMSHTPVRLPPRLDLSGVRVGGAGNFQSLSARQYYPGTTTSVASTTIAPLTGVRMGPIHASPHIGQGQTVVPRRDGSGGQISGRRPL